MSAGRPLVALLSSLALHGGGGLLLVATLGRPESLPSLLVDLTVAENGRAPGATGPATPSVPGARAATRRLREAAGVASPATPGPDIHPVAVSPPVTPAPAAERPRPEEWPVAPAPSLAAPVEPSATAVVVAHGVEPAVPGPSSAGTDERLGPSRPGVVDGPGLASGSSTPRGPGSGGSGSATGVGLEGGGRQALAIPESGAPGSGGSEGDYTSYLAGLRQRIQEVLRYPLPARRRGVTGTVHVELLIAPDGRVTTATVVESSSHRLLDEAAVVAVRSVAPLPFPTGLPRRALRVRLPVVFDLR